MRGDRYSKDYEKIRRAAGMSRPEFPDDEVDAGRAERIAESLADFHARMQQHEKLEAEQRAKREAEMDRKRNEWRERMMRSEYEQLGLEPSTPLMSLPLLLSLGWKIESVIMPDGGYRNELVRPVWSNSKRESEEDMNT